METRSDNLNRSFAQLEDELELQDFPHRQRPKADNEMVRIAYDMKYLVPSKSYSIKNPKKEFEPMPASKHQLDKRYKDAGDFAYL